MTSDKVGGPPRHPALAAGPPPSAGPPPAATWKRRFLRRPGGLFGAGWLLVLSLLSATTEWWRPYAPDDQDPAARLQGPSSAHWLGTDDLGRDLLTRIFTASGPTLLAAAVTVAVAFAVALPLVLMAAEHQRRVERVLTRGAEVMLALPATVILLAVIGALGARTYVIMAILGVLVSAAVYRVLLGVAQSLHNRLYVDAARVDGAGRVRIGVKYVLPGMANVLAVQAAQLFAVAILVQSGLAFMGFGPAEPTPSWGGMVATASQYVYQSPWMMVPTGVVLALAVIAANMLADALVVAPDGPGPKRRRRPARQAATPHPSPKSPVARATAHGAEPAAHEALLEVRHLGIGLVDGPPLATDLSFSLSSGRVLGLIGESGCGKTVTALSLLGLLPPGVSPTGGSIRFQGQELVGRTDRQLRPLRGRELAMIPQDPMVALDPLFTVGHQLMEPIRRLHRIGRKDARRRAIEQLRHVGITDPERVLRAHPHELSGGMAQRVSIAIALTASPRLLIADEPTTALDVTVQMEILDLLASLVKETDAALIIVSHDMGVIADICDDVAVMYAGQIIEQGPVAEVLEYSRHPYTMALLAANPHLSDDLAVLERLATIPGQVPRPGHWPDGCRFAPRCRFAVAECSRSPIDLRADSDHILVRCARTAELKAANHRFSESGTTGTSA